MAAVTSCEKTLNATKFEKPRIHFKSEVFAAVAVFDAKATCRRTRQLPKSLAQQCWELLRPYARC